MVQLGPLSTLPETSGRSQACADWPREKDRIGTCWTGGQSGAETPSQTRLSFLTRVFGLGIGSPKAGRVGSFGSRGCGGRSEWSQGIEAADEDCTKMAKIARAANLQSSPSSCNLRAIYLECEDWVHEWLSPRVRKVRTTRHGIGMNTERMQGRLGPAGVNPSHPELVLPLELWLKCWHYVPTGAAISGEYTNPFRG